MKAVKLNFKEPPPPYIKKDHEILDAVWFHKEKASSISYFSSCSQIPRNLKAFQISSYPSDLNYKVVKRVQKKNSLYSVLEIEKKKPSTESETYIAVYTTKEKDCFFNLNLVAPSQRIFEEEMVLFKNFIQNFKSL